MYTVVSLTKNVCLSGGNCSYIVRLSVRDLHGPTATTVGDAMKKVEECYLKDLYAWTRLEKDREQGNANKEVMCAEVNTTGRSQWQSGGNRQRTWTQQKNQ